MAVAVIETIDDGNASAGNLALNTADFTPNPSVGDLLIGYFTILNASGVTITLPAGWTLIRETTGDNCMSSLAWKLADASDAAGQSHTWSKSGGAAFLRASMSRITGHRAANMITASSSQSNASSTTVTSTTVTPAEIGSLIMFFIMATGNVTVSGYALATSSPTFTEVLEESGGGFLTAMAWGVRPEITATGNGTATLSSAGANVGNLVVISAPQQSTFADTVTTSDALMSSMSSIISDTVNTSDDLEDSVNKIRNTSKNNSSWVNPDKS